MELLVVTLTHTTPRRDADGLARMRLISDTIRNAPGLVNARFYHSGEAAGHGGQSQRYVTSSGEESRQGEEYTYYMMLTTWEDEEFWQQAQERYNPRHLLQESTHEPLFAPPEQWLMSYLWGYSRPAAPSGLATAYLATLRTEQAEHLQQEWIEGLRRQAAQPTMAFAFLARSRDRETDGTAYQQHTSFLNLLSWPNAAARAEFYTDQRYIAINNYLSSIGSLRVLALAAL